MAVYFTVLVRWLSLPRSVSSFCHGQLAYIRKGFEQSHQRKATFMAEAGHGGPGTAEGLCLAISLKKTMQIKAPCMCTVWYVQRYTPQHTTRAQRMCAPRRCPSSRDANETLPSVVGRSPSVIRHAFFYFETSKVTVFICLLFTLHEKTHAPIHDVRTSFSTDTQYTNTPCRYNTLRVVKTPSGKRAKQNPLLSPTRRCLTKRRCPRSLFHHKNICMSRVPLTAFAIPHASASTREEAQDTPHPAPH